MSFMELRSWAHGCRTGEVSTIGAARAAGYDRDAGAHAPASGSIDGAARWLVTSAVNLHRMHAAFELAHVDGGREVRVATAVFSAVERLSQQQKKR